MLTEQDQMLIEDALGADRAFEFITMECRVGSIAAVIAKARAQGAASAVSARWREAVEDAAMALYCTAYADGYVDATFPDGTADDGEELRQTIDHGALIEGFGQAKEAFLASISAPTPPVQAQALRQAIVEAHEALCSGQPPCSDREVRASRILRQALEDKA